jgi:hypothetical protein
MSDGSLSRISDFILVEHIMSAGPILAAYEFDQLIYFAHIDHRNTLAHHSMAQLS